MADGKQEAEDPYQDGQGVQSLPDIPAKKGYSAQWPDIDYGHLTFSRTLEAEYTPYASVITGFCEIDKCYGEEEYACRD